MTQIKIISAAVAILCCGHSAALFAQSPDVNPSWYLAPSVNIIDPDSDFGLDQRGEGLGLRIGKPVSRSWDVQLGTTYARAKENGLRYQQNTLGVDGLYMFSRKTIRPFLLVGAGVERDKVNSNLGQFTKTSPYVNAGIGVQVSFNDRFGMQADFRRVHGYLRDDAFRMNHSNNNYLTVGLTYAFAKSATPMPLITPLPEPIREAIKPAPEPTPEPIPMPKPKPVDVVPPAPPPPPVPRFEKYTLSATELFAFDSANLQTAQPKLDEIATALNGNMQIANVVVTGYADRLGSAKYNLKLSEKRALAVKNYLVNKGINASRLIAEGKGEADPVVVCDNKKRADLIECLEPNRRVEVSEITIERRIK